MSREAILAAVNHHRPPPILPELPAGADAGEEPADAAGEVERFCQSLAQVGGKAVRLAHLRELPEAIRQAFPELKNICSPLEDISWGGWTEIKEPEQPHGLAEVDLAVVRGEFAVAENGAVWVREFKVTSSKFRLGPGTRNSELGAPKHRALLFLAQHLALVVSEKEVVRDLHQAYSRLSFSESGYGVFISGPSKTADIEQSLVMGAHGPRSLTVFLTGA